MLTSIHPPDNHYHLAVSKITQMIENDPLLKNLYGIVAPNQSVTELIFSFIIHYNGRDFFVVWITNVTPKYYPDKRTNKILIKQLNNQHMKLADWMEREIAEKTTGFKFEGGGYTGTRFLSPDHAFINKYKKFLDLLNNKKIVELLHNDLHFNILTQVPSHILKGVPSERSDFYK
jgi:hypothetical protein